MLSSQEMGAKGIERIMIEASREETTKKSLCRIRELKSQPTKAAATLVLTQYHAKPLAWHLAQHCLHRLLHVTSRYLSS